jgi:UDP-N-acetylglucosamine acyltransferase
MIQPLAYIHPQAKIANNVVIEPYVTVHKNVEIGEGTWIGSNAVIMEGARIGSNCKIFPGAVISAIPQDLKFNSEETIVRIGNNTTIREFCTINRGTKASWETSIGNNCLLMAYVHVAHDCQIGNNVILSNSSALAGHIKIDDWAIIGGMAAVHQFVNIGAHAFIAGAGLVRKDVPPYTKAAREPLSYSGINSIGLRRRGFSAEKIKEIQDLYRIIFVKGYNISQALRYLEAEWPATPERDEIISFINNSSRGIMKGFSRNGGDKS